MLKSYIKSIEYYLPAAKEFNDTNDPLVKKIGIEEKHIAGKDEYASDLAFNAAQTLFNSGACKPEDVDFLIYCTQSPDYILPTTACILQDRLNIPTTAGAFDYNLGCSGYVYGLSMAKGLIESGSAQNVLLLTGDTYSKYVNPRDRSVNLLFGDAGSATLISSKESTNETIGPFIFGTDGSGYKNLIVPAGGIKEPLTSENIQDEEDEFGNFRSRANLFMNGPEIFNFTIKEIPRSIEALLKKESLQLEDYDFFVFHQANQYMLEYLRKKVKIPPEKFSFQMKDCGNTVSATIPIALYKELKAGKIKEGDKVFLLGFGVGYSWAACSIKIAK
jgi:3-oxoacyl-[acyl-carrier-protein] synthase-3